MVNTFPEKMTAATKEIPGKLPMGLGCKDLFDYTGIVLLIELVEAGRSFVSHIKGPNLRC